MAANGRMAEFAAAVLAHGTATAAGRVLGINERTARRWCAEPQFQAALTAALDAALLEATMVGMAGLRAGQAHILDTVANDDLPPALRLRAALAAVDMGLRLFELRRLAEAVAALEQELLDGGA